jgi:hypothetical protein
MFELNFKYFRISFFSISTRFHSRFHQNSNRISSWICQKWSVRPLFRGSIPSAVIFLFRKCKFLLWHTLSQVSVSSSGIYAVIQKVSGKEMDGNRMSVKKWRQCWNCDVYVIICYRDEWFWKSETFRGKCDAGGELRWRWYLWFWTVA